MSADPTFAISALAKNKPDRADMRSGSQSVVRPKRMLPGGVDGRSAAARRFRDLTRAFEAEIGGALTEADRALIRLAAAVQLRAEQLQADIIKGEKIDDDQLIRIAGTAKRMLGALSAKASGKKPGSALKDYLANKSGGDK